MPALAKARWQLVRDSLLLLAGIAIAAHETLIAVEPRVTLLTLACGMMGLPAALLADRRLVQAVPPPPPSPPTDGATP
jgi:hypothetical protein